MMIWVYVDQWGQLHLYAEQPKSLVVVGKKLLGFGRFALYDESMEELPKGETL